MAGSVPVERTVPEPPTFPHPRYGAAGAMIGGWPGGRHDRRNFREVVASGGRRGHNFPEVVPIMGRRSSALAVACLGRPATARLPAYLVAGDDPVEVAGQHGAGPGVPEEPAQSLDPR